MALTEIQAALAKLYTDAALRARWLADPPALAAELSLATEESQQLAGQADQLRAFAASLQQKRLQDVAKLLPRSYAAWGQQFGEVFRRHAAQYLPQGQHKQRADALAFSAFVERLRPDDVGVSPWLIDVLRYEAACLQAADPGCRWLLRRFHYAVNHPLDGNSAAPPRPTLALWVRLSRRRGPVHLVVPWHVSRSLPVVR